MRGESGSMKPMLKTRTGRWLLASLSWTVIGCIFALPSLSAGAGRMALLGSLAQWWSWGLLSWAIVAVDQRLPFSSRQPIRRIVAHLFLSPLFTAVYLYLVAAVLAAMQFAPWSRLLNGQLLLNAIRGMFLWSVLVYWLIVGVWQAYLYHQRYLSGELRMERLERSFSQARLSHTCNLPGLEAAIISTEMASWYCPP